MSNVDAIKIRMYNTGSVGDCLLLLFQKNNQVSFSMLIDCGGFNTSTEAISKCVTDIKKTLNGNPLDLVVVTHEHLDHVSGFNQAKSIFDTIGFNQVWMAWTEDNTDPLAKKLKSQLGKKIAALTSALTEQHRQVTFKSRGRANESGFKKRLAYYNRTWSNILDALHFEGRKGFVRGAASALKVPDAMIYVKGKSKSKAREKMFRKPGEVIENLKGAEGVKFYILGPPYDADLRGIKDKLEKDEMYSLAKGLSFSDNQSFLNAVQQDSDGDSSPFNKKYHVSELEAKMFFKMYNSDMLKWRQIEEDWMDTAGELAIAINSYTNNTSLAMAIELVNSEKVLLFPADAQSGNWISWHNSEVKDALKKNGGKDTDELLSKTIFYKVGHHGSHNGTASKSGLDKINSKNLVAMMPLVQDKVPTQWGGSKNFPAKALYKKLIEKTNGAVIRTDEGVIRDSRARELRNKNLSGAMKTKLSKVSDNPLYQEWIAE